MTTAPDFQPKNLNELEAYLDALALKEGIIVFALYKSIQRLGGLSSPDVMEYVRVAQKRMAEAATLVEEKQEAEREWVRVTSGASLGYFPDGAPVQPSDVGIDPLDDGDEVESGAFRFPADSPLPIAGNPASGVENPEDRVPEGYTAPGAMTPAQQRMAKARAARQANLARKSA